MLADEVPTNLSVTIDDNPVEVFMSYGLLTELINSIPTMDDIQSLGLDSDKRDAFLSALIAERDKSGKKTGGRNLADVNISIKDVESLLKWGQKSLLDFFLRRFQEAKEYQMAIQAALGPSSSTGMEA